MTNDKQQGRLYLVGIGPGDPELMTCKAVRILEQGCEVVEADSHLGMTFSVQLLVNGEGAPHQGLCLVQAVCVLEQGCQVVEADGHLGMISTVKLLIDGQGAPH